MAFKNQSIMDEVKSSKTEFYLSSHSARRNRMMCIYQKRQNATVNNQLINSPEYIFEQEEASIRDANPDRELTRKIKNRLSAARSRYKYSLELGNVPKVY